MNTAIFGLGASVSRALLHCLYVVCAACVYFAAVAAMIIVWGTVGQAFAATPSALVRVPEISTTYRLRIEREAIRNFGLDAPVARLAAQVHQESGWRPDAASAYAHGLAQFTPSTARWLPSVCPAVGEPDPWDPDWSLRAQACYMAWLHGRVPRMGATLLTSCSRWNFALRAYNGGEGWMTRERRLAIAAGMDGNAWAAVEPFRARAKWAHRENTEYPRRILFRLEPAYRGAGWPGVPAC